MRTTTIMLLFAFVIATMGCVGGNREKKGDETGETVDTALAIPTVAPPQVDEDINDDIDMKALFEKVIVNYSPEEIKQLLGKTEPESVLDLFVLLPDSFCYDYSAADRLKIAQGERVGEYGGMALGETDIPNGYINLSGAWEGIWEMFARKEGDGWRFALNQQFCGPVCYTHMADTYTYQDGTITLQGYANLAGYQDVWVELFIDFDQLNEQQKEQANSIWQEMGYDSVLFRLPRDGKTITMHIDPLPYLDAEIPESAIKEVTAVMWE